MPAPVEDNTCPAVPELTAESVRAPVKLTWLLKFTMLLNEAGDPVVIPAPPAVNTIGVPPGLIDLLQTYLY